MSSTANISHSNKINILNRVSFGDFDSMYMDPVLASFDLVSLTDEMNKRTAKLTQAEKECEVSYKITQVTVL